MDYLKTGSIVKERYEVLEIIGEGAFGAVYRVSDKSLHNKEWALKELIYDFDNQEDRELVFSTFQQESKILSTLKHKGIPEIADYFIENERAYLVMDIIPGKNLEKYLESRNLPLSDDEIIEVSLKLCDILKYLHNINPPVIFRDLKPSNIIIDDKGDISLIDFGIARIFQKEKLTDTLHMGTVGYASPEQYGKMGGTDNRSDLYSLGALMHYMATGKDPMKQAPFSFAPSLEANEKLNPGLSKIIEKLLQYKKEDRYQGIEELESDLEKIQQGITPEIITPEKKEELIEADKPKAKGKGRIIISIALLLILLSVLGYILHKKYYAKSKVWLHEQKYYSDGKKYLEIVSFDPPSGCPFNPKKVKKIVVKFNHPVNFDSLKRSIISIYPITSPKKSWLSEDNTVLELPVPHPDFEVAPKWVMFLNGVRDSRQQGLRKMVVYNFRNSKPSKKRFKHGDIVTIAKYEKKHGAGIFGNKNAMLKTMIYYLTYSDSYHPYQRMYFEKKSVLLDRCLCPVTLYDSEGKKWTSDSLKGKNTLLLIQRADGSIFSPDQMDIAKTARKFFSPEELKIIVCYISVDKSQLEYQQKEAGKDILVLSDLMGCRGPLFNSLVNSYNVLPLSFFINKKGIVKGVFTGLISVKGIIENAELLGAKTNLPSPDSKKLKDLKSLLKKSSDKYKAYTDIANLYEKAGNVYEASLNNYQALRYNNGEPEFRKKLYDRFYSWGMNKEAADLYLNGQPGKPEDSHNFYLAAKAGLRFGHPNYWGLSRVLLSFCNDSEHSNPDDGSIHPVFLTLFIKTVESQVERKMGYMDTAITEHTKRMLGVDRKIVDRIKKSKESYKNDPEPFRLASYYYRLKGDNKQAYKELEEAKKLKGFNDYDKAILAGLAAKTGHIKEAGVLAKESTKTTSSAPAHYALGMANLKSGNTKKAAGEFEKALSLEQWDPQYYYSYSKALTKLGKKQKAKEMLKFGKYISDLVESEGKANIMGSGSLY